MRSRCEPARLRKGALDFEMNTTHHIEHQAVSALIPYARNSRTHSDEQVAQIAGSIREFGFTNPVLIDRDGTIIAGHGRVMAARKLGMETVPCIRLGHLTPAQVRAYVIADNKLALNAGWDEEMLRAELDALREDGFDAGLTGFSTSELDAILAETETISGGEKGNTPQDNLENYENSSVRQIVLIMGKEEFDEILPKLEEIKTSKSLQNNTEAAIEAIRHYANTLSQEG